MDFPLKMVIFHSYVKLPEGRFSQESSELYLASFIKVMGGHPKIRWMAYHLYYISTVPHFGTLLKLVLVVEIVL